MIYIYIYIYIKPNKFLLRAINNDPTKCFEFIVTLNPYNGKYEGYDRCNNLNCSYTMQDIRQMQRGDFNSADCSWDIQII